MNIIKKDIYSQLKGSVLPVVIYGTGNGADKIINEFDRRGIKICGVAASDDFVRGQSFRSFTVRKISDFDRRSKDVYEKLINYKLSGSLSYLRPAYSDKDEVFKEILCLSDNESYLDLGAYRGDTIDELLHYTSGKYNHITALEPDRKTFAKLKAHVGEMKNIRLYRMGIWSDDTDLPFNASLGRGSGIRQGGSEMLAVTRIDTLYHSRKLTYLKMDVEGCERQAIIGGVNTLRRDKPKLNIAVYHRSEDIFSIPLLISSIVPGYRLYLRQHPYIPTNMLIHRTTPLPPVNISENEENVVGSQYCKNVKYICETVSTSFSFL